MNTMREIIANASSDDVAFRQVMENLQAEFEKIVLHFRIPDAAGCVNEALFRVVVGISSFRGSDDIKFLGWARTLCRNLARDYYKAAKRRPHQHLGSLEIPLDGRSASEMVRLEEEKQYVFELLFSLSDDQQQALYLKYYENWSYQDIAEHLGKSKDAVTGLLVRGLMQIRLAMTERQLDHASFFSQLFGN